MSTDKIKQRLEYLRGEIEAERISYGEIAELQSLVKFIDPSDTLLLEWAGVDEKNTEKNSELKEALKSLVYALSTDIEDYPDSSYYTLIMDRRNRAQALLYELENEE